MTPSPTTGRLRQELSSCPNLIRPRPFPAKCVNCWTGKLRLLQRARKNPRAQPPLSDDFSGPWHSVRRWILNSDRVIVRFDFYGKPSEKPAPRGLERAAFAQQGPC